MIKDTDGNELTYWPISGLVEGENSQTLQFIVENTGTGKVSASVDSRLIVWARPVGNPIWVNIAVAPIPLSGYPIGDVDFECYVEALSPIVGLERVPVSVVAGSSSAAGWVS
jgi:hypothetical protein